MDRYEHALASPTLKRSESFFAVNLADVVVLAGAGPFECVIIRNFERARNDVSSLRFS